MESTSVKMRESFSSLTYQEAWKEKLVKATGTNKNLAALYLERLKSGGGTNISDALEEAFILAGPGALDTTEALEVETIFLLSDGAPTIGKIRSRSGIIEKCGEWNSTLGIGPQFNCGI